MLLPESLRLLLPDGTVKRILLEDYLRGVVAAALSPDAPLEAQKALAVAARTFAAHTHRHTDRDADVCTTRHCQAWSERANPRAARAVIETRGIVAAFDGEWIQAFYFEHCDGKTRGAQGVLMDAPAYLQSVSCPCGFASLKGHGFGMCLRGMVAMARGGDPYDFILKHYYTGITLERLEIDENARDQAPIAPRIESPRPKILPSPRAPKTETEKPPRTVTPPRRSFRKKAEPAQTPDEKPQTVEQPNRPKAETSDNPALVPHTVEGAQPPNLRITQSPKDATTAPPVDPRTFLDAHSPEQDDLLLFLAVEDVAPKTKGRPQTQAQFIPPPSAVSSPPPAVPPESMPEEIPAPEMFAPPPSMPEDLPSASELDFIAPPSSLPEDELGMPPQEFLKPAAPIVEPNLGEFIPPVERFYAPLDAPPTMPEEIPSFHTLTTDETPISWVAPPPIRENTFTVPPPQLLIDSLPGPRVIAGNLPKSGMVVTIRDTRGNSVVTVSGAAKQYGSGGFEAPLTDDGAYQVKFDGTELDVRLENETVFIYFQ